MSDCSMIDVDSLRYPSIDMESSDNDISVHFSSTVQHSSSKYIDTYNICKTGGNSLVEGSSISCQSVFYQDLVNPIHYSTSHRLLLNSVLGSCCTVFGNTILNNDLRSISALENYFINCLFVAITDVLYAFGERFSNYLILKGYNVVSIKVLIYDFISYIKSNVSTIMSEIDDKCLTLFCSKISVELRKILINSSVLDGITERLLLPGEVDVLESCFNAVISSNKRILVDSTIDRYTFYLRITLFPDDVVVSRDYKETIISYCSAAAFSCKFSLFFSKGNNFVDNTACFDSHLISFPYSYFMYNREKLTTLKSGLRTFDAYLLNNIKCDFIISVTRLIDLKIEEIGLLTRRTVDISDVRLGLINLELDSYRLRSEIWKDAVDIFDRNFFPRLHDLGLGAVSDSYSGTVISMLDDKEFVYSFICDLFYSIDTIFNRNLKKLINDISKDRSEDICSCQYINDPLISSNKFIWMFGFCIEESAVSIINHGIDLFLVESKYHIPCLFDKLVSSYLSSRNKDDTDLSLYFSAYKAFSLAKTKSSEVFYEKIAPKMQSLVDSVVIRDKNVFRIASLRETIHIIRSCIFDIDNSQLKIMDYAWRSAIGLLTEGK
ncbi:hypothetical protein [Candidatus Ichthyocystis sparus]|uniref:hypothetical protein n=1 Tax=Candidatus Ichthyocystis sparus TaxID=1561004 RepID=UPI000B85922F|nr:hypothetical protein [Candidatus Ichthyocystis sparus]